MDAPTYEYNSHHTSLHSPMQSPVTEMFSTEPALDHRKRRRNRTTQSCLNCHTSKRKCDRKRPCSRCITLGLTGLCVYEVDDAALRDDPNVDEITRLRGRIAELESLVRELKNKPHPKWSLSSNSSDRWHNSPRSPVSMAGRRPPALRVKSEPDLAGYFDGPLYTFNPDDDSLVYPATGMRSTTEQGFNNAQSCGCHTSPSVANALVRLTHSLRSTANVLHSTPDHAHGPCALYDRVLDLYEYTHPRAVALDPESPTGSDVLTPISSSSSNATLPPLPTPADPHHVHVSVALAQWDAMQTSAPHPPPHPTSHHPTHSIHLPPPHTHILPLPHSHPHTLSPPHAHSHAHNHSSLPPSSTSSPSYQSYFPRELKLVS